MSEYRKNTNNNPFGNNNKTNADTQNTRYPAKDPEQAIKQITDKLEKGIRELYESEKYKNFLNTMSKFHRYSFNNNVLISMQKPNAAELTDEEFQHRLYEALGRAHCITPAGCDV